MKRAVATLTFYVYGETEEEIKKQSQQIKEKINKEISDSEAEIEGIYMKPWGELGQLKKMK